MNRQDPHLKPFSQQVLSLAKSRGDGVKNLGANESAAARARRALEIPAELVGDGVGDGAAEAGDEGVVGGLQSGFVLVANAVVEGQLGDDSTDRRSSPVQTVAGGNNWFQVACGYSYTAAVKTDGTLHVWGSNYDGQLGTNDTDGYSSPVQTVTGGNNWKAVACGNSHTLALDCDGNIWSFGSNSYGELGDSTTNDKSSPVQIETASSEWAQVFAGGEGSGSIRDDKTLWVWGFNPSGELGTGNTNFYSSPVQTVMNGNNWKSGAFGTFHALLLKN